MFCGEEKEKRQRKFALFYTEDAQNISHACACMFAAQTLQYYNITNTYYNNNIIF